MLRAFHDLNYLNTVFRGAYRLDKFLLVSRYDEMFISIHYNIYALWTIND